MIKDNFFGREFIKRPLCPFCGIFIERPIELKSNRPTQMPVGRCSSCGSVYACDITGHDIGSALIEALMFGCNMDWDLAWDLLPDEDYYQEIVENYDPVHHFIVPRGYFEGRRIRGVLYFIKFHEDVLEVTDAGVQKKISQAASIKQQPKKQTSSQPLSKKEVETLVNEYNVDAIINVAESDKKIIRHLQRLLYSGDDQFRHRAADILGQVCAIIGDSDPKSVVKLIHGLFYSISDTAAAGWGAFETIAEIIKHRADLFGAYIPQLYQFLADDSRRAKAIQALGSIAEIRPDLIRMVTYHFHPYLLDPDPKSCGYTVWLMGNLKASEMREDIEKLLKNGDKIEIYEKGRLIEKTVGQVAQEAIAKL